MLTNVFSLWIEGQLPPMAIMSINSFIDKKINFDLYCYEPPINIDEINDKDGNLFHIKDASEILPKELIYRHMSGSLAPFADWWRYEKLYRDGGVWVDLDLVLLKEPKEIESFYCQYSKGRYQPAIGFLSFEANEPIVDTLRKIAKNPSIIAAYDRQNVIDAKKNLSNNIKDEAQMRINAPWDILGPDMFEGVVGDMYGGDPKSIYPIGWEQWRRLYNDTLKLDFDNPNNTSEELRDAWALHLWNDQLRFEQSVWQRMMPESVINVLLKKFAPEYSISKVVYTPQRKTDVLIGVCSCQQYVHRRETIRKTWIKKNDESENNLKCDTLFFYGGFEPNYKKSDEVCLNVDDSYNYLPLKLYTFFKWALENYDFKYLFKCDDDTYVVANRFEKILKEHEGADLICSAEDFMPGGGGYFMSHKLIELIVKRGCNIQAVGREDDIYGQLAQIYGINIVRTPFLKQYKKFEPELDNNIATCHWCQPPDMIRIYKKFEDEELSEPN